MNRIVSTAAATIIGAFALLSVGACKADIGGSSALASGSSLAGALKSAGTGIDSSTQDPTAPAESGAAGTGLAGTVVGTGLSGSTGSTGSTGTNRPNTGAGSGTGAGTGPKTGAGNGTGTGKKHAPVTTSTDSTVSTDSTDSTGEDGSGSSSHESTSPTTPHSAQPKAAAPRIKSASIECTYSDTEKVYSEFLSYEVENATGMALSIDNPGIVGSFGTYDWHGTIEIPNLGCYAKNGEQTYTLYTVGGHGPQASKTIVRTGTHTMITPPPFSTPTTKAPIPTPSASTTSAAPTETTAPAPESSTDSASTTTRTTT